MTIEIGNREYFTDGIYLYYYWDNGVAHRFDEIKKVDGIYSPRHMKILESLTKVNSV